MVHGIQWFLFPLIEHFLLYSDVQILAKYNVFTDGRRFWYDQVIDAGVYYTMSIETASHNFRVSGVNRKSRCSVRILIQGNAKIILEDGMLGTRER